jgi:hypothetical protein
MKSGIIKNASANNGDSMSTKMKSSHTKSGDDREIVYANPGRPLDFSFKEVRVMEDLRKMEPRSGVRRPVAEIEKEDAEKNEGSGNKYDKPAHMGFNFEDELSDKLSEKKPKNQKENEVTDVRRNERMNENKIKIENEEEGVQPKKKVKYLTYNNTVILHSNKIRTLMNTHNVFREILPEVSFLTGKGRSKIDLIQWIDLSHNLLVDIHPDILNLPFLKIFYCHANCIEEINSVAVLSQCKSLLNLTLHGNPIEHIKGYRHYIIELVPSLEKLDYTLVSEKELDIIFHRGSRYGEKRDKKGRVVAYPKIDDEVLKRMKKPRDDDGEKKEDN